MALFDCFILKYIIFWNCAQFLLVSCITFVKDMKKVNVHFWSLVKVVHILVSMPKLKFKYWMLSRLGVYFYYRVILPDTRKSNYTEEIEPVGLWTKYHISFRQIILGYYQQKIYFCKYLTCWDKLQSQGLERVVERIFFACHSYQSHIY